MFFAMSGLPVSQVQPKTIPPSHWINTPVVPKHSPPQGIPDLSWYSDHTRMPAKPPPPQAPQFSLNHATIVPKHDPPKSPQDSPKHPSPPPKHAGYFPHGEHVLVKSKPKPPPPLSSAKYATQLVHGAKAMTKSMPKGPPPLNHMFRG